MVFGNIGAVDQAASGKSTAVDTKSAGMSQGAQAGINMGLSAIGGIMQARAAEKARQREFEMQKQTQKLSIGQRQANTKASLLDSLAANLANSITGS